MKKEVLVLFKTHLDIGFTDYSENVIDKYLKVSIPKAIEVGNELKDTETPFKWIMGSWMVWEALKYDTDGSVDKAVRDGIISWHALPFTTHTELMNKEMFEYGLEISEKLDKKYGRKTIASKMTDVPGHTLGMVPIIEKHGVKFMHIGVNPATPIPPVPHIFKWKCNDSSLVVMYQQDYGTKEEFDDFVIYFAHTGDNIGPQSAKEVVEVYDKIREEYPDCEIKAATMEDVAERVLKMKDIPEFTKEIGDTWIHGAGTDPKKMSGYRKILRSIKDKNLDDFDLTESAMLVAEHTWGMNVMIYFHNDKDYFPKDMERAKSDGACEKIEKSWREQRSYVEKAEKVLGISSEYNVEKPNLEGYKKSEHTPDFEISWQIFDNSDYDRYRNTYMRCIVDWSIWDFTKVGLPDYKGGIYVPRLCEAYEKDGNYIYKLAFEKETEELYGLPYFWAEENQGEICVKWYDKKMSRLPQACWLKLKDLDEDWQINKMGRWISPEDIVGSPLITAVDEGVKNKNVKITPIDSCLVAPYGRRLLQYNVEDKKQDMYFNLYNNIWNTNFPMWYTENSVFRFEKKEL